MAAAPVVTTTLEGEGSDGQGTLKGCEESGTSQEEAEQLLAEKQKSYSSKFELGTGSGMIVGLPQSWPVLGPVPFLGNECNPGYNPGPSFYPSTAGSDCLNKSCKVISTSPIPVEAVVEEDQLTVTVDDDTDGGATAMISTEGAEQEFPEEEKEEIPEVGLPKQFSIEGKTKLEMEQIIQNFCDCLVSNNQTSQQVVAELASQIYRDNDELYYVMLTDTDSYPVLSKQLNFVDDDYELIAGGGSSNANNNNNGEGRKKEVAFSTLFNVGFEIFVIFIFSPMEISFLIEEVQHPYYWNEDGTYCPPPCNYVFFYGYYRVDVRMNAGRKIMTIEFLQNYLLQQQLQQQQQLLLPGIQEEQLELEELEPSVQVQGNVELKENI